MMKRDTLFRRYSIRLEPILLFHNDMMKRETLSRRHFIRLEPILLFPHAAEQAGLFPTIKKYL